MLLVIGIAIENDVGIRREITDESTQVHADIIGEVIAFDLDKVSVFIHHPDRTCRPVFRLVRNPVRLVDERFHILVGQKEAAAITDDVIVICFLRHRGIYRAAILRRQAPGAVLRERDCTYQRQSGRRRPGSSGWRYSPSFPPGSWPRLHQFHRQRATPDSVSARQMNSSFTTPPNRSCTTRQSELIGWVDTLGRYFRPGVIYHVFELV